MRCNWHWRDTRALSMISWTLFMTDNVNKSINQPIETNLYSALCRKRIRGTYRTRVGRLFTFTVSNVKQFGFQSTPETAKAFRRSTVVWQSSRLTERRHNPTVTWQCCVPASWLHRVSVTVGCAAVPVCDSCTCGQPRWCAGPWSMSPVWHQVTSLCYEKSLVSPLLRCRLLSKPYRAEDLCQKEQLPSLIDSEVERSQETTDKRHQRTMTPSQMKQTTLNKHSQQQNNWTTSCAVCKS